VPSQEFARVTVKADKGNEGDELVIASKLIQEALNLREKYQSKSYSCAANKASPNVTIDSSFLSSYLLTLQIRLRTTMPEKKESIILRTSLEQ